MGQPLYASIAPRGRKIREMTDKLFRHSQHTLYDTLTAFQLQVLPKQQMLCSACCTGIVRVSDAGCV